MGKLLNAPLQEVIFDLSWELEKDSSTGLKQDPGHEMAVGQLKYLLKEDFPIYKKIESIQIPLSGLAYYKPLYQYWKSEGEWPVVQLGPGLMTVNEVQRGYEWDSFSKTVQKAVECLEKAYERTLPFNRFILRYMNSVKVGAHEFTDWSSFIEKNLNFNIHNGFSNSGKVRKISCEQIFETDLGQLQVVVSSGKIDNEDALIWHTAIGIGGPLTLAELTPWLEKAHTATSDFFVNFLKSEFYAKFR